ncbi:MAG: helix-turn-helix domain-containing protein [Polyangiales bacterium]
MKPSRRMGAEDSVVRSELLDAAEALMLDEGYAAVTSRRLAAKAGVKQPLVYYYFRTMDELFLAVFRRLSEQGLLRLQEALTAPEPIRALWGYHSDRSRTALTVEFLALANHRKDVQAEIARYAEQFRALEVKGLTRLFATRGVEVQIPPLVVTLLLTSLARGMVQESALGISKGHAPTRAFVEACLSHFEQYGTAVEATREILHAQKPKAAARTTPVKPRKAKRR